MLFTSIVTHAQNNFNCDEYTSTNASASGWKLTTLNPNGGTVATGGLRIEISGSGNLQVIRNGKYQIYYPTALGTGPNDTPLSSYNGLVVTIGNQDSYNVTETNPFAFTTGSLGYSQASNNSYYKKILPTTVNCINNTVTQERHMLFDLVRNGLTYKFKLIYSYTIPNLFFTVTYEVIIPTGNKESVHVAQGWDTYLDGQDSNPGFKSGIAPNLVVGTQKVSNSAVVYEAFKYKSGVPWSGYYSATYSNLGDDLKNNYNTFSKIISTSSTDNGIGISVDFGYKPGTFQSVSDLIFNCNAPQTAPIFSSTTEIITCGKPVDLTKNLTSNPTLVSGVTIGYYDPNGNRVSDPKNITKPGVYTIYYSDANNANCTSPSAEIIVKEAGCCTIQPSLSTTTITNSCPSQTINLTQLVENILPLGITVRWYKNNTHTGFPIANPNAITETGTYYAFFYDASSGCYSPVSVAITATITQCCLAGNNAPVINIQ